jgi:hexosaminidase
VKFKGNNLARLRNTWHLIRQSICAGLLSLSVFLVAAQSSEQASESAKHTALLLPMPREYSVRGQLSLASGVSIVAERDEDDRFAAHDLELRFEEAGVRIRRDHAGALIEMLRASSPRAQTILRAAHLTITPQMQEQGYAIASTVHGLAIIADTSTGLFYGAQTVKQMIQRSGSEVYMERAVIRDWPAMRYRGLSDDLSRGPVPTLDFQEKQIRTFAAYKLNVYSPYFENTLQYVSNPLPSLRGGSMSPEDARTLVEYARRYHITIIPEQEAFGHLHHVLIYEQYAPLAETPMGSVLAPGQPGSLDLIQQWFDEIAGIFPGPFLHIGADETFELGKGQTKAAVDAEGLGKVYVDFLTQIHARLAPLHRQLLFWGDIAVHDPKEVLRLPKDMIAVAWDYAPRPDGYMSELQPYIDAGMETWVSPGVSNWSRVYPDNDLALRNIQRFTADGQSAHSTGMLNTVWNDDGQTLFVNNWYGVLFGAATAWQQGSSSIEQYQAAYGPVFHGDSTGKINKAQQDIIAIYELLRQANVQENTDTLYWADPWSPEGQVMSKELRPVLHEMRLRAEDAVTAVAQARASENLRETDALDGLELGARRLDFIGQKFETADRIATIYRQAYAAQQNHEPSVSVPAALWDIAGVDGFCADMRDSYSATRAAYSDLWLRENRPYLLQNVLSRYDMAIQLWMARSDRFLTARNSWRDQHTLPSPAELGIPAEQEN